MILKANIKNFTVYTHMSLTNRKKKNVYWILDVQKRKGLKKTLEDLAGVNISEQ